MEADIDRDDARSGGLRRVDAAGADANQFVMARLFVCSDVRLRFDSRHATHVRIDRSAVRVQLEETDSPPPGTTNRRSAC